LPCRGYLAPESDSKEITFKLDIYSLGVIIMEILTGKKGYSEIENVRILHMTNPRQGYNVKKISNYQTIWFCAIYNCNPNTIY